MSQTLDRRGASADDWLERAIAVANVPTLACLLVHLTGDRRWIEPPFTPKRLRGLDDNDTGSLPESVQGEIRTAAQDALKEWYAGRRPALPNPPDDLLIQMMSVSLGDTVPLDYAAYIRSDLDLPP